MQVKDCGESECRSVTERIEVVTSPYTKVGRLPHSGYNLYKKLLELSKGGKQMNEIKSCAPADLWTTWEQIQWNKCEHEVRKLQARIVKAQMSGRHNKVKALQWMLTHSFYGKALAVKRVTSNGGKKTAGVDHVLWNTPNQKMDAIASLKRRGYHPQPLRRVNIKKSNGKLRPLGIPTLKDRAMQALYHMALDPVAETTADTHSYGFRKERSTKDAKEMCFTVLARKIAPQWVLEGDIKGCFDHISHEWLLNHIPMDKVILRKWLKSGYVFHNKLYPTYEGTPQGGIISPTLANMVLNGMQTMLSERFKVRMGKNYYNPKINLVRYADDFIVTGKDKEILENEVKPVIKELSRFKQEYSQAASVLVGDIKTLLMDSQDKYFEATQTVYEWCGVATQLLAAYIFLFDEYNEKKASAQKDILIKVLDDGITKLNEAQKSLLVSSQSFNNASGKLLALDSQLTNDFSEKSSYFQSQVDKIRKEAYAGAAAGVVAGPFGLIISYSIAAGVVEGKLIPELKNKLKSVQSFFTTLSNTVKQANKDIDAAKLKLTTEIAAIGEIKTETETTRFYVDYDDLMLSLLKEAAKKMINTCNEYQKRHGKKTLFEVPEV